MNIQSPISIVVNIACGYIKMSPGIGVTVYLQTGLAERDFATIHKQVNALIAKHTKTNTNQCVFLSDNTVTDRRFCQWIANIIDV